MHRINSTCIRYDFTGLWYDVYTWWVVVFSQWIAGQGQSVVGRGDLIPYHTHSPPVTVTLLAVNQLKDRHRPISSPMAVQFHSSEFQSESSVYSSSPAQGTSERPWGQAARSWKHRPPAPQFLRCTKKHKDLRAPLLSSLKWTLLPSAWIWRLFQKWLPDRALRMGTELQGTSGRVLDEGWFKPWAHPPCVERAQNVTAEELIISTFPPQVSHLNHAPLSVCLSLSHKQNRNTSVPEPHRCSQSLCLQVHPWAKGASHMPHFWVGCELTWTESTRWDWF